MKKVFSTLTAVALLATSGTASAVTVLFQGLNQVDPGAQSTFIIDVEITDVGALSEWTTFDLSVQLEPVVGTPTVFFDSVQDVSGASDYIFAGTSDNYFTAGGGSTTAHSSDETSLADGVPASLANPLMARFIIDISGAGVGQAFKISLCGPGSGCLNTNRLNGFEENGIGRLESIVANDKTINVVPIPAAVWLFGSALVGMFGWSKRRSISI